MRHGLPLVLIAFAATASSAIAAPLELPTRKAGLWELKMAFEGRNLPPQTLQHCTDAATDKQMTSLAGNMRQDCSKQDMQKSGNTITVDSVCAIQGATITSHAVITGDFNSAYTVKVTSKRSGGPSVPGMPAEATTNMTIDAKYTGACKADQKPGDMIMPGGQKINVNDMQNRMGPGGAGGPPGMPKKN
jgi:hypothetical protein